MRTDISTEIERLKLMNIKPNFSEVARRLNCDRRTVSNYYKGVNGPTKKTVKKESILTKYIPIIESKTDTCSASAMSIYRYIQTKGYSGKYGLVKNYVKTYKNNQIQKATIRFETFPGFQAQVDWKERKKMISKHGEIFEFNLFLYILGYSRVKYLELTFDKTQSTLFKCINNAFEYTGGIPKQILFDNMRTVVDQSRTHLSSVVLNSKFEYFSKDFGFESIACMPYRPQTKGKVESLAKLTNRIDVYNYEFEDEQELIDIVKKLNYDLNNEKSQAINEPPIKRLEKEKEHLRPLLNNQIIETYISLEKTYSVSNESMITYKGNKYSVPTYYIGKKVKIKLNDSILHIYFGTDLIAAHELSESFLNYKRDHVIEILKSDSLKYKDLNEIERFVEDNLKNLDMLIT